VRLPLIAPRSRTYRIDDGAVWERKRGELLRPDAFTRREIGELRQMKGPGFETLQQQKPGARERLRIKADSFGIVAPKSLPQDRVVVLSVDPGQKGGPTHSFSVVQSWALHEGDYVLLDQWREQARYPDFRDKVKWFIRKYRPSAVLIEATGQGPALSSEIHAQVGMEIVLISPRDDKVTRLRKHRKVIHSGRLYLAKGAVWTEDFLEEITLFPYAATDDQVDAMSQFLDWISKNPLPKKRQPRALMAVVSSNGTRLQYNSRTPATDPSAPGLIVRATRPFIRRPW
jgi:predicted phage terminase large subunit-like protein